MIRKVSSCIDPAAWAARGVRGALGAFALATPTWIAWGIFTPGDFFANGSPLVTVTLLAAGMGGTLLGWTAVSRWSRGALLVLAALSLAFWALAPNGWWARRPPQPAGSSGRPALKSGASSHATGAGSLSMLIRTRKE